MQSSVSQRPLTAKKRQLQNPQRQVNGLHQRSGLDSDSHENLLQPNSMAAAGVSYGNAGRMPASSIPAFRTATNRNQLMQRNSQEGNHHREAGPGHTAQSVDSPMSHEGLTAQPQSQQRDRFFSEETDIATAQQGNSPFTQHINAVHPTRSSARDGSSNDRQGTSYKREGSSAVAGGLRNGQHLPQDRNQDAYKSLMSQHGSKAATWLPDQQFAASGQIHNSSRADTLRAGQAAAGAKPVMYVKPPWAIDDPYQVQCHSLYHSI